MNNFIQSIVIFVIGVCFFFARENIAQELLKLVKDAPEFSRKVLDIGLNLIAFTGIIGGIFLFIKSLITNQ